MHISRLSNVVSLLAMDVEHLRWFLAVADREHVTGAAAEVHVSQPALSRALARLEAEVGVPLFSRRGRSLRLNRYGATFRSHVQRALAELDQARLELADVTGLDRGVVSLAFGPTHGTVRIPALLAAYHVERPEVRFQLREGDTDAMRAWLSDGEVDLILTSPRPAGREFSWVPVLREQLLLAVPPTHPLARRREIRLRQVADEPFVALKPGFGLRALADDLCRRAGFAPKIAVESEDPTTIRSLVAAGLGLALVPAPHSTGANALPTIPYLSVRDQGASRTVGIAWVTARYRSPATDHFRKFVLEHGSQVTP
jgi:LysR family transcriptional regulator, transcription activator of glutamate synthase operon